MKITGIRIDRHSIPYTPKYFLWQRVAGPLDIYDEFNSPTVKPDIQMKDALAERLACAVFLTVTTDGGFEGTMGPIEYRTQLITAAEGLAKYIIGRDPLENRLIWDIMSRFERHARSGVMMMAISTVDIALWDLKGKILGQPVYKLLGGGRSRVKPYASTLGFSVEPDEAREAAVKIKDMGIRAQKWFFRYGPNDGTEGMKKNINLALSLRETLGDGYDLMFDCWTSWNISYARPILKELEPVRPIWIEEILRPQMADAYRQLKNETSIPLSAGEHLYTRMEVNAYLRDGVFAVIQSDPEWCGGITEALRIADMCEVYGTTFIPHGHSLMPALHVVASMPPDVSPYAEYLLGSMHHKTNFFKRDPLGPDGFLTLNEEPGLGQDIDLNRVTKTENVTEFYR
ncbi:MAG: hypothetical protein FWE82_05095 [Defluviitaleaceae bacterium]|nr:hypothetical protein [Defluviitaleaceae bacterium]